jgi:glycerol-3-phosphate dehydrogenase
LYLTLHFYLKHQKEKLVFDSKSERDRLKKIAEKIIVKYDELEIKTRSWKQEIVVGSGTKSRNEYVDVNQNYIYLKKLHRGHYFEAEFIIEMNPDILRMKLAYRNELDLYFNPTNLSDFFLDLDFLFN